MKGSYFLPSIMGSLFFLALMWLDLYAIQHTFESMQLTWLMCVFLVLQALFFGWYACYCESNPACTKALKIMLKRFCWVFLGLSITSLTAFIFNHSSSEFEFLMAVIKFAFIVSFILIIATGIGLVLLVMGDDAEASKSDQGFGFQYGSSGYKKL